MKMIFLNFSFLLLLSTFYSSASAETAIFEVGEIQTVVPGPGAVHPRENPIGGMTGLATVEFAIAFVDDSLQFYATVYDSPDTPFKFNVIADIYYDNDKWFGYLRQGTPVEVPANSDLFPMGGAFFKVHGISERISESDLKSLQDLRLEVSWYESSET